MIVYHGSTEIIKNPDVVHSKKYLDFGRGFYITTFENQAKKWAVRKGMRQEKAAIVNVYELAEEWDDFNVLSFGTAFSVRCIAAPLVEPALRTAS